MLLDWLLLLLHELVGVKALLVVRGHVHVRLLLVLWEVLLLRVIAVLRHLVSLVKLCL